MPPATAPPAIRPAVVDDAPEIAAIATTALADKYGPALGGCAPAAVAALVRRDLVAVPDTRRWVAEIDGRLAGTVSMALGHDPDTGLPAALAAAIGWPRAVRAVLVLGVLGHGSLAPDEAYIDELAVADWARRRGAARALIETCAAQAAAAGRARLTLWVTIDNAAARALYASAGFREARRRRWLVGRVLFGAPGAILMERALAPAPPA